MATVNYSAIEYAGIDSDQSQQLHGLIEQDTMAAGSEHFALDRLEAEIGVTANVIPQIR